MENETNIVKHIGEPAVLETCAEECSELAQACLKLSRKLRNEQPTPKTKEELINSLTEEAGDVIACLSILLTETQLIPEDMIFTIAESKIERWDKRINTMVMT